jgi:hypothetical protein
MLAVADGVVVNPGLVPKHPRSPDAYFTDVGF